MNNILKKTILLSFLVLGLIFQPVLVLADTPCPPGDSECGALPPNDDPGIPYHCNVSSGSMTLKDVILCSIDNVFSPVSILITSLAGLIFVYGLLQYITTSGNQSKRDEAKKYITFGVLGLLMMLTFWGLAKIITTSLFGSGVSSTAIPYPVKR